MPVESRGKHSTSVRRASHLNSFLPALLSLHSISRNCLIIVCSAKGAVKGVYKETETVSQISFADQTRLLANKAKGLGTDEISSSVLQGRWLHLKN